MASDPSNDMQSNFKRKAYASPEVIEYGTLRDVTLTVGRNGASDGPAGRGNNNKTSV